MHRSIPAFTLIELLVVVTIIVVLLALLTPALDKAIYSAELAADGAGQRGIAMGVTAYAMANGRNYPRRLTVDGWGPNNLNDNAAPNGRVKESLLPLVEPYFG